MRDLVDAVLGDVATLDLEVVAHGGAREVPDSSVPGLVGRARAQGLVGLLDQSVALGSVGVSEVGAAEIGDAAVAVSSWCLQVERHAIELAALFERADVDHRFLKGLTIAHRFESHPGLRSFADVDVLVLGADVDRVVDLLLSEGHERLQPEWRPGFVSRWGKSVTLRAPNGVEVDLHRTFASGPYGVTGRPDVLWARPAGSVEVGGETLACLDVPSAFVHACVHVVAGQTARLASLRDVAMLAGRSDLGLDAVAAVEDGLGVQACVTAGVGRAWSELGLAPSPTADTLVARTIPRRDRRWLDLYRRDASFRRMALEATVAVPGTGAKARYVVNLVSRREVAET